MREVAAEAGFSTGSVTHYFADKQDVLVETLRASLRGRRQRQRWSSDADPVMMLRGSLEAAMVLDDDARLHWLVTTSFCAHATADDRLAGEQQAAYRGFRDFVVGLVRAAQSRGSIDGELDARFVGEHLIAVADGIAVQALFDPASWPPDRQRAHLDRAMGEYVAQDMAHDTQDHDTQQENTDAR